MGSRHVPAEQWRLAAALGFTPCTDIPASRLAGSASGAAGLASLVFLLCFKSFAIVLALGGGPARATLEVAIYEALKIELDFTRAAWLALIQLAICLSITIVLNWTFTPPARHGLPVDRPCRVPIALIGD